ncbi:MAG: 4Fe-4S dicluster domain-containing protein, partial [Planctomycetota bacterium]|nr:4Fe-4S dicluster domain-containing protein [Planctomycetota bacterium]
VYHYPTTYRCVACNTCTKSCPQDIDVMGYVQAVLRDDIAEAANLSFDCVMCGLCATRCPAEIPQFLVGILARRLYGAHLSPKAAHTRKRVSEIEASKFDEEINSIMKSDLNTLKKLYEKRKIEE